MKKKSYILLGLGLSVLLSMTACEKKSSEEPKSVFSSQSGKEEAGKTSFLGQDTEEEEENVEETTVEVESEQEESEAPQQDAEEGTLEDIFSTDENQKAIQAEMDSAIELYGDYYSDITFVVEGNDISYNYYFAEGVELGDASMIDSATLETQAELFKDNMETAYGIRPDSVSYNYYNADGSIFASFTF